MKKFLLLSKILLKTGLGNGLYDGKENGKSIKKAAVYILLGICMIPFIGLMGYMGYTGYNMFNGMNTGIILGLTCYLGVFLAFFSGMTMCIGVFYNSSDIEFLLPMPLKAEQIVGAKFVTMYVYTTVTDLLFILPVFVGYGMAGGMGAPYWIMAVITCIIIPVTPLVYGSLFAMLIIRLFKRARNKDFITVLSTIFALLMVIGINAFTSSIGEASQIEMVAVITEKGNSIMEIMNNIFPNTALAEKAVSNESPLMLLLFILSAAAFVALFMALARFVYIKTVTEMSSAKASGKKLTSRELKKAIRKNSQIRSYVYKELRLVFRTPIYFMNCVMLSIMWPVILAIPIVVQLLDSKSEAVSPDSTQPIQATLQNPELTGGICMLAVFAITVLAVSFCMMNTTCISREGSKVIFMKYIPMSFKKQLIGKVMPGIIVTLITGTLYSLIGIAVAIFVFDIAIPPAAIVLSIVISALTCIAFNLVDIVSDIIRPKLEWQTEQAAVKQNLVAVIPTFITIAVGIALGAGAVMLTIHTGVSVYVPAAAVAVILAVMAAVFYVVDIRLANKYFARY